MILEYWLANMRTLSVVCATLVAIMIISGSLSFPVFAQTPGPPNPNANKTTAYTLLHQNETYHLQSGGVAYNLPYIIKNGASVKSMDIYADKFMLEITISAPSDGSLTLTLPRELMDAKVPANLTKDQIMAGVKINPNDLQDANYIVTVNQKLVNQFTETKNPNVRILSIPFHQGDTTIDIIGTMIVPEFGQIAALVLAIAIISIIAVSAKTGLRFMPGH